jgi:hypothetical protein
MLLDEVEALVQESLEQMLVPANPQIIEAYLTNVLHNCSVDISNVKVRMGADGTLHVDYTVMPVMPVNYTFIVTPSSREAALAARDADDKEFDFFNQLKKRFGL